MLLYYIRHGDPTYDPDELTPLGKRQAEAVARRLSQYGLDEIYVSSSNRAQETCRPTCEILKKVPVTLDWTNEKYAWRQLTPELGICCAGDEEAVCFRRTGKAPL